MTKFKVAYTKNFKKSFKKIKHDKDLVNELKKVVNMLANGEILDKRYKNHNLNGEYKNHEECHIRPDFLLIYRKENKILVLTLVDLGSHSELFG